MKFQPIPMLLTAGTLALAAPRLTLAQGAALAPPESAAAAQSPVVEQLVELNTKAIAEYRAGRHTQAEKILSEALGLASDNGLAAHDMAARTHVHLGIVAIAGLHQREVGMRHFVEALRLKPGIKLSRQLATPGLKRDFRAAGRLARKAPPAPAAAPVAAVPVNDQAKSKETAAPTAKLPAPPPPAAPPLAAAGPGGEEPDVPMNVPQPLYCPTPLEGPPQADVKLHCLTQPSVRPDKVILYYRPGTGETYTAVTMNRTPKGWYSAVIPARQVTGRAVQFYFQALEADRIAAANGKDELPNVIVLKQGAPPVGVGALAALDMQSGGDAAGYSSTQEEETPLEARERAESLTAEDTRSNRRAPGKFWVGVGGGSAWGWHLSRQLERHESRQVSSGFSPAGLAHASPEIGLQLTRRLALSLQSRHQFIPSSGSGDPEASPPPESAHAVLLRLLYAYAQFGDLQLLGTVTAGYGSALRMKVNAAPDAGLITSDTIVAGPGVAGPGLGLTYHFTSWLAATLEARALAGFPDFGVLGEGTAALQYTF